MTVLASLSLAVGQGVNPSPTGVEVPNSRRLMDFTDVSYARLSYSAGGAGACAVGLAYSTDLGGSWVPLIPPGPLLGGDGVVLASEWTDVQALPMTDVYIAAVAYGATLLGLGLYTLRFVELQVR